MKIEGISACAEASQGKIVILGRLVLFSMPDGDAWILDARDGLALCLVEYAERQQFEFFENERQFGIEWNAGFDLSSGTFAAVYPNGTV